MQKQHCLQEKIPAAMLFAYFNDYLTPGGPELAQWCRLTKSSVLLGLVKARLARPLFGSQTQPPRSSRFWPNQSDKFILTNQLFL
ncbi:hypothetical protein [Lactiplantibacillus songbeiensis]|uniref:Uncharacterized protein n=1 Tax=Lactiplantibacillus songbeiensis TaxID=2559920 RepID=A0ABW4BXA7_9LACO|nr:hypothetical protein [Lactiplantibacillus songbeiensis]